MSSQKSSPVFSYENIQGLVTRIKNLGKQKVFFVIAIPLTLKTMVFLIFKKIFALRKMVHYLINFQNNNNPLHIFVYI